MHTCSYFDCTNTNLLGATCLSKVMTDWFNITCNLRTAKQAHNMVLCRVCVNIMEYFQLNLKGLLSGGKIEHAIRWKTVSSGSSPLYLSVNFFIMHTNNIISKAIFASFSRVLTTFYSSLVDIPTWGVTKDIKGLDTRPMISNHISGKQNSL